MTVAKFIATTTTGFEDVAAEEVEALLNVRPKPLHGKIEFEAPLEAILKLNIWSRTVNKVILLLNEGAVTNLDDIYSIAANVDYTDFIGRDQSFAVRAERVGEHHFTSLDVAATVGRAVIDSFLRSTGHRLKVDLDNPDVEVLCQLRGSDFYMGLNTTGESLHRRNYRVFDHPASLKATIAASMIYWSRWRQSEPLLDPMCGGGTIPIEGALMARNIAPGTFRKGFALTRLIFVDRDLFMRRVEESLSSSNSGKYQIFGVDISPKFVEGAKRNASAAKVEDTIDFECWDATKIDRLRGIMANYVIVNLPYGMRLLRKGAVAKLYVDFLASLRRAGSGTLIAITASRDEFKHAARINGFDILDLRTVLHGSLSTTVFKCAF